MHRRSRQKERSRAAAMRPLPVLPGMVHGLMQRPPAKFYRAPSRFVAPEDPASAGMHRVPVRSLRFREVRPAMSIALSIPEIPVPPSPPATTVRRARSPVVQSHATANRWREQTSLPAGIRGWCCSIRTGHQSTDHIQETDRHPERSALHHG